LDGNAPEATADFVLQHLAETVGLMVERPNGGFGFVHVNFQEYFAAVAIAQRAQRSIDTALDILRTHLDDDRWRNVTTLAVAYIGVIQRRDEVAGDLAWDLASTNAGRPGRSIVLAGEAVVAASPDGVSPPARALIVQALPTVIRSQHAAVKERADAGDALASLGDPRFRADMGYLPDDPLLGFVRIDAGPFMVSTWPSSAFDGTWGQRVSHLPAYLIARYPVTVEQFREYIQVSRITAAHPDALLGPSNHPVVGVSWFDAQAYCEWLTRMLRSSDKAAAGITTALGAPGAGWAVRLPTEEQWERAARGGDDRPYPWGMKADPDCANYFDTGLLRTTAVGTFPKGASVDGVEDLSGNVWEWTLSPFDSSTQQRRVLRGGAFSRGEQDIRTTSRNSDLPDARYDNLGFRVVICADSSQ
jgi:formylglycine-generating enzyme required for sulfatase activity